MSGECVPFCQTFVIYALRVQLMLIVCVPSVYALVVNASLSICKVVVQFVPIDVLFIVKYVSA